MSHIKIILSLYNATTLLCYSSTITHNKSANFDSLVAGILIFFTPASIFAEPNGGGLGSVTLCSKVYELNTRITPSEQPQNKC